MNIVLWILQILLAIHTLMGAVWKASNSEQAVSSLGAIPHGVWLALGAAEVLFSLALVVPGFYGPAVLVPIAALCIAAEMLLFCGIHMLSGATNHSPVVYWLVVAAVSAFIACGRLVLEPIS